MSLNIGTHWPTQEKPFRVTSTLSVYYTLTPSSLSSYPRCVSKCLQVPGLWTPLWLDNNSGPKKRPGQVKLSAPKLSHSLQRTHTHTHCKAIFSKQNLFIYSTKEALLKAYHFHWHWVERWRREGGGGGGMKDRRKGTVSKIGSEPGVVIWSFISGAWCPKGHLT